MKKVFSIFILVLAIFSLFACAGGNNSSLNYPDFGYAEEGTDSWLQRDDEIIDVTWYADSSTYSINDAVKAAILKYTGININFQRPVTDDGSKLTTYVAGKLPDVITITDNMVRVQLEESDRVYPIQTLAEKYAPSLLERVDDEILEFYKGKNGLTYCLPNNFYTTFDMEAYEKEGYSLQSNGILVVRKDYLEAYLAYKKSDLSFEEADVTTPNGFLEMCKWVKSNYNISNANPTFLLDSFSTTSLSNSVKFLAEYFNCKPENSDGSLNYQPTDERYEEMLMFLNKMYNEGIISSSNFSANKSQIGQYIQRGLPFACIVASQEYTLAFKRFAITTGSEYVPIVLTNSDGEAPQLRNLAGNGLRYSMITESCQRPDRVIKLFDFLYSDEGQRLMYFGVEGESYEYTVEPGDTAIVGGKEVTYPYGKVKWTDDGWNAIQQNDYEELGISLLGQGFLWNPMMIRLMHPEGDLVNDYAQYINYNLKAPMTPYTFNNKTMRYPCDPSDPQYLDMVTLDNELQKVWIEYIPKIIMADATKAKTLYNNAVKECERLGLGDYLEFNNKYFQIYKKSLGIEYGYPANDPNSCYANIKITSIYGDTSLLIELPEGLYME